MVDWLQDTPKEPTAEEQALENMFHYYIMRPGLAGGLFKFYKQNGVSVDSGKIVFDSPQHRTMFLLRWL